MDRAVHGGERTGEHGDLGETSLLADRAMRPGTCERAARGYAAGMTTNDRNPTGEPVTDPAVKREERTPAGQVDSERMPEEMPQSDIVTAPDGSGTAGGASGGSGGGSGMPGHPDAAR
ncbi:hypothetical protein GCM10010166_54150 [Couchioplanes caeruleus subsp. azureus]|nr:hypothetical protein GCM10010166_54150 [Couchioplanes caeruleus subsp. azureus]